MSFVGSMFSGSQGAGFQGSGTNILQPSTVAQANQAYAGAQGALGQQQAFTNALQAQNGIGNQSSTYNQLQNVAQGQGPNPAQAMLAQSTGQNVANQAALMGSQRGASQNVGMMARQAANQGANLQQQAVGQGATMQANQSLGALGQMAGVAGTQVAQQQGALGTLNQAQQGEQGQVLGGIASQNQANVGMQSNVNNANTTIASGNQAAQGKTVGGLLSTVGLGGMARGGEVGYDMGGSVNPYAVPPPVTPVSQASSSGGGLEGAVGAIAKILPMLAAAEGGMVPRFDQGGSIADPLSSGGPQSMAGKYFTSQKQSAGANPYDAMSMQRPMAAQSAAKAPASAEKPKPLIDLGGYARQGLQAAGTAIGNFVRGGPSDAAIQSGAPVAAPAPTSIPNVAPPTDPTSNPANISMPGDASAAMSKGGKVAALVSPGEVYLPPKDVKKVAQGADSRSVGERIPGKAKASGDSYDNDTVHKDLKTGGVMIPRSVMNSKDPAKEASKFVAAILAKHGQSARR